MHRASFMTAATAFATLAIVAACSRAQEAPPSAATVSTQILPFMENDYPAALARAKEQKIPLFVDVWAPW
jgi:hypothetical protein